jgi:hypothetical protein
VLQSRHLSWRDQKGQNCKIYFSKIIFKILFKKGLKIKNSSHGRLESGRSRYPKSN